MEELAELALSLSSGDKTFRVRYAKTGAPDQPDNEERLRAERRLGLAIHGEPDLRRPEMVFGVSLLDGRWLCGEMELGEPIWLRQNDKPRQYSTALPSRAARAAVNIAVPEPQGVTVIGSLLRHRDGAAGGVVDGHRHPRRGSESARRHRRRGKTCSISAILPVSSTSSTCARWRVDMMPPCWICPTISALSLRRRSSWRCSSLCAPSLPERS